jgi:hypothetical protein
LLEVSEFAGAGFIGSGDYDQPVRSFIPFGAPFPYKSTNSPLRACAAIAVAIAAFGPDMTAFSRSTKTFDTSP